MNTDHATTDLGNAVPKPRRIDGASNTSSERAVLVNGERTGSAGGHQ